MHNSKLNAVITLDPGALQRAEEIDRQLAAGHPTGRLHGLPITIKDTFATGGVKATRELKDRANHVPEQNAATRKTGSVCSGCNHRKNRSALPFATATAIRA